MRVVGEKGKLQYLDGPKVQSRSSFLLYYGHKILMANMYDKLLTMYIFLIACINKKDHIQIIACLHFPSPQKLDQLRDVNVQNVQFTAIYAAISVHLATLYFLPQKKKVALGPPKKYPSNLLAQLHKKVFNHINNNSNMLLLPQQNMIPGNIMSLQSDCNDY